MARCDQAWDSKTLHGHAKSPSSAIGRSVSQGPSRLVRVCRAATRGGAEEYYMSRLQPQLAWEREQWREDGRGSRRLVR